MKEKIAIVTGANSGIGYSTAEGLVRKGTHLVMICRDAKRGQAAREQLLAHSSDHPVDLLIADLSSQDAVRQTAAQIHERYPKVDVLINNAGGMFAQKSLSADGYEMTFALNYLAPFLLSELLLDRLQAAPEARIVNIASVMQADRLELKQAVDPPRYSSFGAYRTAKTALIMYTYELARRLEGTSISVNALHPGVIATPQSMRSIPRLLHPLTKLFMSSPETGAQLPLYLATSAEAASINGKYFQGSRPKITAAFTYDEALQQELYQHSLNWTNLVPSRD